MEKPIDVKKTLEIIERLKLARIGEYKKWEKIAEKLRSGNIMNGEEHQYFTSLSRTYKQGKVTSHSKIYHTRLSEIDESPPCLECGEKSRFYCNMNDAYFCEIHLVGHDENEI